MYGQKLSEARQEEFLDEFRDEDPDELDRAFKATRGTTMEFPTPAHVRAQLKREPTRLNHERLLATSAEILARDSKPPDWEPLSAEELANLRRRLKGSNAMPQPRNVDLTDPDRVRMLQQQAEALKAAEGKTV